MCYTTNGTTPVTNGALGCTTGTAYTTTILVSAGTTETIKAVAGGTGYTDSTVGSALYTIFPQAATPTCVPSAGTYTIAQSVACSDGSSGTVICYTTNGTVPATNGAAGCSAGTLYTVALPITITTTLNLIAGGTGYGDSVVASLQYVIPTAAKATIMAGQFIGNGTTVIIKP